MQHIKAWMSAISRVLLAAIFWLAVEVTHGIEVRGLRHDTGARPAYFAMLHRRDLDPMVEISVVLGHRGWRALAGDVHFAMRSDAFSRGFLARIVTRPRWFARFVRVIPLDAILHGLGIFPLENLYQRPAEVWITDALFFNGDITVADALDLDFVRMLAQWSHEDEEQLRARPLSRLLAWRYQELLREWQSVDIFHAPLRGRLKRFVLTKMQQELTTIAASINRGESVWGAPEGQISPDGTTGNIAAAMHRILAASPSSLCIVPISITYDFMTTGRARIFVDLAPTIEHAPLLSQNELDAGLRSAWLSHLCFTCTGLASHFLVQASRTGTLQFSLDDMARCVERQARALHQEGRPVDRRLLHARTARRLVRRYMRYAERHRIARRAGYRAWIPTIRSLTIETHPGGYEYRANPLAYAWNEYQEMLDVSMSSAGPGAGISAVQRRHRRDPLQPAPRDTSR